MLGMVKPCGEDVVAEDKWGPAHATEAKGHSEFQYGDGRRTQFEFFFNNQRIMSVPLTCVLTHRAANLNKFEIWKLTAHIEYLMRNWILLWITRS